jgi:hypothetical protein
MRKARTKKKRARKEKENLMINNRIMKMKNSLMLTTKISLIKTYKKELAMKMDNTKMMIKIRVVVRVILLN